jgi:hypothetical protein
MEGGNLFADQAPKLVGIARLRSSGICQHDAQN